MKCKPWIYLAATLSAQAVFANAGLDAYRQGHYTKAASFLVSLSDKNPVADYYLGRMRLYGYGELKNNVLALRYFKKAAEKGHLAAQNFMAQYALLQNNDPDEALYWFKKAAGSDDTKAQMYCAAAYMFGFGTKKNPMLARKYYIAAAKNGNPIAQYTLADYFLESRYSKNKKLGLIWLNKAAEQGDPKAQVKLGALYLAGDELPRDLDKAKMWAQLAVKQAYPPAYGVMGDIFLEEKAYPKAENWYKKAAEQEVVSAQVALAHLYLNPDTSLHDSHLGFLWMLKAAQNHNQKAQLALAKLYKEGKAVAQNDDLATAWEKQAKTKVKDDSTTVRARVVAWLSHGKARSLVASGYRLEGMLGAWHNPQAFQENNYNQPPQMVSISSEAIYKPQFVMASPNEIEISVYYDALASAFTAPAELSLNFPRYPVKYLHEAVPDEPLMPDSPSAGKAPVNSAPVQQKKAFDGTALLGASKKGGQDKQTLFDRLSNQAVLGNVNAQFMLGQMYEHGIAVQKDRSLAIHHYELAAAQNDLRAAYNLGLIYLDGHDMVADPKQGLAWLTDAAFKGNALAQYSLAQLNEQGLKDANGQVLVVPNIADASSMYYLAAANDYSPAQFRLAELLVRAQDKDRSVAAKAKRHHLIKTLYEDAVAGGVQEAVLPLAFFDAMSPDVQKQHQAFEIAKQKAESGNEQAALLLGIMYDRGIGVEASPIEAIAWYQKATSNPVRAFILGTYYSQGEHIEQDLEKGRALLQEAADAGFSYANLNLAVLQKQHQAPFLAQLDKARLSGNATAGLLLADYYLSQKQEDANLKQARDIYRHFAGKGDRLAQLKLAFMYDQGLGGPIDATLAEQWYTKSAKQAQPLAQYLLGQLYQLGQLTGKPDYEAAKYWYRASKKAFPPASVALGFLYETVEDDYKKAAALYETASKQNLSIAAFDAGLIYEYGKERPVDFEKARVFYLKAANQGHPQAMAQLAGLYFKGQGGERDEEAALSWYQKAAERGEQGALYQLGLLSETGVLLPLNVSDAVRYYQAAADQGNAKAMLALARIYQYGLGEVKNPEKAAVLYKKLASLDNPYAQYQLATFYYEGKSGERLPKEGEQWLQRAQSNGSTQARKVLQWLKAQSETKVSYIEPVSLHTVQAHSQPADLMYLDALNEWNRGEEQHSRMLLDRIMIEFPDYKPASIAYQQLSQQINAQLAAWMRAPDNRT